MILYGSIFLYVHGGNDDSYNHFIVITLCLFYQAMRRVRKGETEQCWKRTRKTDSMEKSENVVCFEFSDGAMNRRWQNKEDNGRNSLSIIRNKVVKSGLPKSRWPCFFPAIFNSHQNLL